MNTHLTDGIGELNKKLELPERKKQSDSEMEAARLEIKSLQEKLDDTISQLKGK